MSWIVWLILAAVLGVAELLTVTLTLGLLAVAAAVAGVVGAAGVPVPFQIVAFVVAAGAGLGLVRPIALRHLKQPPRCGPGRLRSSAVARWSSRKSTATAGGYGSAARSGRPAPTTRPS